MGSSFLADGPVTRPAPDGPVRVLVVHRGLLWGQDESAEVNELVAGLLAPATGPALEVLATEGRRIYRARLADGTVEYLPVGTLRADSLTKVDLGWVHVPLHPSHLMTALRLRLRGRPVLLSPMGMLTRDFTRARWFSRTKFPRALKPLAVGVLRVVWRVLAREFTCLSAREVEDSRLPPERCILTPWPLPSSGLAEAIHGREQAAAHGVTGRPLAFVSRWDVRRKGIDRLSAWLGECTERLPRPAVVLMAPRGDSGPEGFDEALSGGLLDWRPDVRGGDLLPSLRRCRGVMLLSRWDGQPRVLREAAALGLPTLSTPSSHFAEVVAVLGKGAIVDGDDVEAIQTAFERLEEADTDPGRARVLLDRAEIGAFLGDTFRAVATGVPVTERSYYRAIEPRLPFTTSAARTRAHDE